jgi:hypothetical protein
LTERRALIALAALCVAGIIITAVLGVANDGLQELAGLIVTGVLGAGAAGAIARERTVASDDQRRRDALANWLADDEPETPDGLA